MQAAEAPGQTRIARVGRPSFIRGELVVPPNWRLNLKANNARYDGREERLWGCAVEHPAETISLELHYAYDDWSSKDLVWFQEDTLCRLVITSRQTGNAEQDLAV